MQGKNLIPRALSLGLTSTRGILPRLVFFSVAILLSNILVEISFVLYAKFGIFTFAVAAGLLCLSIFFRVALFRFALTASRGGSISIAGSLSESWRFVVPFIVASVIALVVICAGLVAFIIPGIIFIASFAFFPLLLVDRGLGVFDSLKESVRMTRGHRLNILALLSILIGVNIIGALFFFVGLLITASFSVMVYVHYYRLLGA